MPYGKTIELYLVDGTADGLVVAELSNWNGEAIKVPRTQVADYARNDLSCPGVYFLICEGEDGEPGVYVGESEDVLKRLKEHLADSKAGRRDYYWNTAVAFLGRDLNKAHIRYLEDQLANKVRNAGRYELLTKATFSNTALKESQVAAMAEFIDNVVVLMGALGYRVLAEAPKRSEKTKVMSCGTRARGGAHATGYPSAGGFTVQTGSTITESVVPSLRDGICALIEHLKETGVIEDRTFTKDYEFSSPSNASDVVMGSSTSGPREWKDEKGVSLADLDG